MKKKSLRRVIAASVAAMLMCAPMMSFNGVFADGDDETPSVSITIEPGDNTVYNYEIYQIFKGDVDADGKITNLDWGSSVNPVKVMQALSAAENTSTNEFYTALHDSLNGLTNSIIAKISAGSLSSLTNLQSGEDKITASIVAEYLNDIDDKAKANELSRLIFKSGVTNATGTISKEGDNVSNELTLNDAGYYLIIDKTNAAANHTALSANILKVAGAATFTPKMSKPTLEKFIVEDGSEVEANTAAIGEDITYQLTTKVPNMTGYNQYYFIVEDTMSEGLTLVPDSFEVSIEGIDDELTNVTVETSKYSNVGTSYYVETGENAGGDLTFRLVFNNFIQYRDMTDVGAGKKIIITYKAKLNNNASFAITANESNINTANLVFSNDPNHKYEGKPEEGKDPDDPDDDIPAKPYEPDDTLVDHDDDDNTPPVPKDPTSETPEDTVYTYTTQLEVTKTDGKGALLEGAKFKLFKELTGLSDTEYNQLTDAEKTKILVENLGGGKTYYKAIEEIDGSVSGNKKSIFTFKGLDKGDYLLRETGTPGADYNAAADIKFIISADLEAENDKCTWSEDSGEGKVTFGTGHKDNGDADPTKNAFITTVINNKGIVLPTTGGIGTTIFYVSGGVLVLGAGVLLITKKRMSLKDDK